MKKIDEKYSYMQNMLIRMLIGFLELVSCLRGFMLTLHFLRWLSDVNHPKSSPNLDIKADFNFARSF